jgi:hypothetical protein
MEMVKSLIEMVTKLSREVQVLKCDNTALKLHLRDLRQIYAPPPSISTAAASSTHDGAARTYRDVFSSGGGHLASTTEAVSATHDIAARTSRNVSSSGVNRAYGFMSIFECLLFLLLCRKSQYPIFPF